MKAAFYNIQNIPGIRLLKPVVLILIITVLSFCSFCFAEDESESLTVAVAANMAQAAERIKLEFEKEYDIKIKITTGSTGALSAMIENNAPFDVFIAADMEYLNKLYNKDLAIASPKAYAKGVLVLWMANKDEKIMDVDDFKSVLRKAKTIAIAKAPQAVYGSAAEEVFGYYRIKKDLKDKLIFGNSVSQTNQFLAVKAAPVGLTAKSAVVKGPLSTTGTWIEIEQGAYTPIKQGISILKYGVDHNPDASRLFYEFMFSNKIEGILNKYGYKKS